MSDTPTPDNEATLREMSISSGDDEEQQAAEWALAEIESAKARVEYTYVLVDALHRTIEQMSISSGDDEEQQAAEWALAEIERLKARVEYLDRIVDADEESLT